MTRPINSTNVRPIALAVLRAGLRLAQGASPDLASAWAERLFLTPRWRPRPARERELLESATPFRVSSEHGDIAAWSWGSGPPVLLVHGWEGRGTQLGALVPHLVSAGLRPVAFDAPGHGDAPRALSSLVVLARTVVRVAEVAGAPHALIGHSLGAAAIVLALADRPFVLGGTDRVVLVAPPTGPSRFTRMFASALQLDDAVVARMMRRIEARYGRPIAELDARALAADLRTPALVVHDEADDVVPIDEGRSIAGAWPGARLHVTQGLGHRRVLRDDAVLAEIVAFIAGDAARARGSAREQSSDAFALEHELFHRDLRWAS